MRIGVNLLPLRPAVMGGAEIYLRDLLDALVGLGSHELVLVVNDLEQSEGLPVGPRCRLVTLGRPGALRRRLRPLARSLAPLRRALGRAGEVGPFGSAPALPEVIARERIDLWFCPFTDLQPRAPSVPAVITVYDLQHEHYPRFFAPGELRHRRAFYRASCLAADHVIAISDFTRGDVIERFGVEPDRVTAVWLAAGAGLDWAPPAARVEEARRRYALPATYAFYPANAWPHKNHANLLRALAQCRAEGLAELGLVLTGARVDGPMDLGALIARHRLEDAVRVLGYVPRGDVPLLYAGARCLVLPSLFEGFGMPLVEAMRAGCPIAAADGTSIPEVAGDAALLFDPEDPRAIARALTAMVRDPGLAADLAARGRARASRFSAAAMARQTLEVFERAALSARGAA